MKKYEQPIDTADPEAWKSDDPIIVDAQVCLNQRFSDLSFVYQARASSSGGEKGQAVGSGLQ